MDYDNEENYVEDGIKRDPIVKNRISFLEGLKELEELTVSLERLRKDVSEAEDEYAAINKGIRKITSKNILKGLNYKLNYLAGIYFSSATFNKRSVVFEIPGAYVSYLKFVIFDISNDRSEMIIEKPKALKLKDFRVLSVGYEVECTEDNFDLLKYTFETMDGNFNIILKRNTLLGSRACFVLEEST